MKKERNKSLILPNFFLAILQNLKKGLDTDATNQVFSFANQRSLAKFR